MNFSKIISLLIPQGKVKSLSINGVKVWQKEQETPDTPDIPDTPEQTQLLAPTISISGNTLHITDNSGGLATSFDILVDGVVKGSVEVEQEETITDLTGYTWVGNTTLFDFPLQYATYNLNFTSNNEQFTQIGTANNEDGTQEFSLIYANSTTTKYIYDFEYTSSYYSGMKAYKTIQITGGTDVTNAELISWLQANGTLAKTTYTIPAGTYVFNEQLDFTNISADINESFTFTPTNGYKSNLIGITVNPVPVITYYEGVSDGYTAYNAGWLDEDYRTITIETDQSVSADFYNWFNTNTLITFTIAGTPYQAENGMTWSEWVNSSYNTLGLVNAGHEINNDGTTNYKNLKYTDTTIVNPSDTIIVNYAYILSGGSGA